MRLVAQTMTAMKPQVLQQFVCWFGIPVEILARKSDNFYR
jgi:hypothetical protein